jgi:hypothetical protein
VDDDVCPELINKKNSRPKMPIINIRIPAIFLTIIAKITFRCQYTE